MLALAVPLLFLHTHFLPGATVHGAHANLADLAAIAVVLAGLWTGLRRGFGPLRAGRAVWIAAAAFFVVVAVSIGYGAATDSAYLLGKHSVTALKLLEYALMAPAAALIVRTPPRLRAAPRVGHRSGRSPRSATACSSSST